MQQLPKKLQDIKDYLVCPTCQESLHWTEENCICMACNGRYDIKNGKIFFVTPPERDDKLDLIKGKLKQILGKWYSIIGRDIIAPTFPFSMKRELKRSVNLSTQIVVNVGCGNDRVDPRVIGIDLFDYEAVDIVCDISKLPFKNESIDVFISRSVLEHVLDPRLVVNEIFRCTRSEGLSIHLTPFMFPFHASPYDYHRFTHKGLEHLFGDFILVRQRNITGPVTLLLLCTIDVLSALFSFGNRTVRSILYLCLCLFLFPIKFLDLVFLPFRELITSAPTILTVCRKQTKE
jgi:SAM-dependent methyltransferase